MTYSTPPRTPKQLAAWQARMGWTQNQAAAQLGVSVRKYAYALAGERDGAELEVPRTIALAAHALERDATTHLRGGRVGALAKTSG